MRREVVEGDGLVVRVRYRDIVEILVHVSLQVDPASLDSLHGCRPRKEFRRRSDAKECIVGLDRRVGPDIPDTVSLRERRLAVDDRDCRTGDVVGLELGVHHAVEERLEGIRIGEWSIGLTLLTGFGRARAAGYVLESERRGTCRCDAAKYSASRVRVALVVTSDSIGRGL
jgi:hypothetical protein